MVNWRQFMEESPLAAKVRLPTRVIVHRFAATPAALAGIHARREFTPGGGEVCELEAGGRVIGRGRIVKRRGGWFLKIAQIAEEGV